MRLFASFRASRPRSRHGGACRSRIAKVCPPYETYPPYEALWLGEGLRRSRLGRRATPAAPVRSTASGGERNDISENFNHNWYQ